MFYVKREKERDRYVEKRRKEEKKEHRKENRKGEREAESSFLWLRTGGWSLSLRIRDVLNQPCVPLATPCE